MGKKAAVDAKSSTTNKKGKNVVGQSSQRGGGGGRRRRNDNAAGEKINKQNTGGGGRKRKNKKNSTTGRTDEADETLRRAIEGDGTRSIIEMSADGNCLFRSISDQLYYDYGNDHAQVRSDVCDYLEAHEDDFKLFLVLEDEDDDGDNNDDPDAQNFQSYVENMRQDGEWGGNLELVVAARLYRRNITVFSANFSAFTISYSDVETNQQQSKKKPSGSDLLLSYHDNDHYNSVRDHSRKRPPPTLRSSSSSLTTSRYMTPVHDVILPNQESDSVEVVASTSSSSSSSGYDSAQQEPETGIDPEGESKVLPNEPQRPSSASSSSSLTTSTATPSDHEPEPTTTEEKKETVKGQPNAPRSLKKGASMTLTTTVKKNDPCPCGSALKYKKCCWAKERHAARLRKMKGHDKDAATSTEEDESDDDDENPVPPMTRDFRAIKI